MWLGLIVCFSGCATGEGASASGAEEVLTLIAPELPPEPAFEPVRFEDRDGGLWLSYEQYRALERNVVALKEYAARLEAVVRFYEGWDGRE